MMLPLPSCGVLKVAGLLSRQIRSACMMLPLPSCGVLKVAGLLSHQIKKEGMVPVRVLEAVCPLNDAKNKLLH